MFEIAGYAFSGYFSQVIMLILFSFHFLNKPLEITRIWPSVVNITIHAIQYLSNLLLSHVMLSSLENDNENQFLLQ